MNLYYILVATIILLIGWMTYRYMNEPQPLAERTESAMQELEQGNPTQAMNEMAPQTRGENMLDEAKTAVGITPTTMD